MKNTYKLKNHFQTMLRSSCKGISFMAVALAVLLCTEKAQAQLTTFATPTPSTTPTTYTVPTGCSVVSFTLTGGCGGTSTSQGGAFTQGVGGQIICTYTVTPAEVLNVYVGGAGQGNPTNTRGTGVALTGGVGATPGGTGGISTTVFAGGGGGGSSAIRVGGVAKANTILEAGGGGGGSGNSTAYQSRGGNGNGPNGQNAQADPGVTPLPSGLLPAFGGTQLVGGAGGGGAAKKGLVGTATSGGQGFNATTDDGGGGGGGGWFGGGGGGVDSTHTIYAGAGGGGSNYVGGPGIISLIFNDSEARSNCGNGYVSICAWPSSGPITGTSTVVACGTPLSLSIDTIGEHITSSTWSSSNTTIATVSAGGVVTAAGGSGTFTITVVLTNVCGSSTVTTTLSATSPTAAIAGTTFAMCSGNSITLTDPTTGGTWSSGTPSVATVGATVTNTVVVTGVAGGTSVITYTNGGCFAVATVTVHPTPGALTSSTGAFSVCAGGSFVLTDAVAGGTYSLTNTTIATAVGATIVGNVAGVDTVTYTATGGCFVTQTFTVIAGATLAPITGTATICPTQTETLGETVSGGTWTSSNPAVATVVAGTGFVTGVAAGTTVIKDSILNSCGGSSQSFTITVSSTASAGTISGTNSVCVGALDTLADATTGGTWYSTTPAIATVLPTTGIVQGVTAGVAVIGYSVTSACGTASTTYNVTVLPLPAVVAITGTFTVCPGGVTTLTDATAGGAWSVSNANGSIVSTGATTGAFTGINAGTSDSVIYAFTNSCGTATTSAVVIIEALPNAGVVTGVSPLCVGNLVTFTSSGDVGGLWSSNNTTIASVTSGGGAVTAIGAGAATISYLVTGSCGSSFATYPVTVISLPTAGTITGASATVCTGNNITLSDVITGGAWTDFNGDVTINVITPSSAVITGVTAGTDTIYYTVTTSCGNADTFIVVTINSATIPAGIVGSTSLCTGLPVTYTDATPGGSWLSSNPAVASVTDLGGGTAVITPLTVGATVVSYSILSSCGTNIATADVTVNATADAGVINGPSSTVCVGSGLSLSETVGGGSWTNTTGNASVNSSGLVTGVSTGTDIINYTVSTACGTAIATYAVTITGTTAVGPITGPSSICSAVVGATFTDPTPGGNWVSGNTTIASITSGGVVSGISAGTVNISYVVLSSCGSSFAITPLTINMSPTAGSIVGGSSLCVGGGLILSDLAPGGTWSSTNPAVASVTGAGTTASVIGVSAGVATIFYTVSSPSCGSATATQNITVNASAGAGVITGGTTVCTGSTLSLTDATGAGTWSSSNSTIANVNSSTGVVTGVGVGAATITYAVISACGTSIATSPITVNLSPSAGSITGISLACVGNTRTLTDAAVGGIWTTGDATIATVSSTGVVTGVGTGVTNIYYTVTNLCGSVDATVSFSVSPAPTTGAITGASSVCPGDVITLGETVPGGTWSSSNPLVATVSSTGVVTGVSGGGVVTISYTTSSSCGSASATDILTITNWPNAGVITGTPSACLGGITVLADTVAGGVWSSGNPAIATVSTTGIVTGVSLGTVNIYYTVSGVCGSTNATVSVNISNPPIVSVISGITSICTGTTSLLTDTATGGVWSSSDTLVATVSTSGLVRGIAAGSAIISYTKTNGCTSTMATADIIVAPAPGSAGVISGATSLCPSSVTTMSDPLTGGTWSSSNTTVATIDASGIVTSTALLGTTIISYVEPTTCGLALATFTVNVSNTPDAGTISGLPYVCLGFTTLLSDPATGGVWSSSNPLVATVNSVGLVTGTGIGTATINYIITESCGSATATATVSVNTTPYEGVIIGTTTFCEGGTTSLTETVPGGTWSSSNTAIAIVSSTGVVTSLSGGSDIITYTILSGCGEAIATADLTINPLPATGTIVGSDSVCLGGTTTLADAAGGGTGIWVSGNTSIATINSAGVVSGVSDGNVIMYYGLTNACGTAYASVLMSVISTLPASAGTISGVSGICPGSNITLSETIAGGAWSSSNTAIATIDPVLGVITGVSGGSNTITYTVSDACGGIYTTTSASVTPTPYAAVLVAVTTNVCPGDSIMFSDSTSGGVWTSSDPTIATVSGTGAVTGVATGSANISYTVSNMCGVSIASAGVFVNPPATITGISGPTSMCMGSTINVVDFTFGGTWSNNNSTVASIDGAGDVISLTPGVDTISYSVTNIFGCISTVTYPDTVYPSPTVAPIAAYTTIVCAGSSFTLTESASDGAWISGDPTIATISGTGVVTGVSSGTAVISYTASNTWCTVTATTFVYVNPIPAVGPIIGVTHICSGTVTSLGDLIFGGVWESSNNAVSVVDTFTGVEIGIASGIDTIYYVNTNIFGCSAVASLVDTVSFMPSSGTISAATTTVCQGSAILLVDGVPGGTWSSADNTIATVDTGLVTGVSAGATNITYTIIGGFCTANSIVTVNVDPVPVVGPIAGVTDICAGSSTSLTNGIFGGTWSTSNTVVETVGSGSGVATGITSGMDTVYYTVTNVLGCSTTVNIVDTVTANPTVSAITGASNVCLGSTIVLSDPTSGGTWSSSNTSIATASSAGAVTGTGLGNTNINYTVTNPLGCSGVATATITVNPNPGVGPITGSGGICTGTSTTLSDDSTGGVWISRDTAIATIDNTLGTLVGHGAGVDTIVYTVYNSYGCSTSIDTIETIHPIPAIGAITGSTHTCYGSLDTLSDTTAGGTWSSSSSTIAPISATGVVTGNNLGTVTISYNVVSAFGCQGAVSVMDTVVGLPVVAAISGSTHVCVGGGTSLSDTSSGGMWSSSNGFIATVSTSGLVTGVAVGETTIMYTVTNGFGCSSFSTQVDSVIAAPTVLPISGYAALCPGSSTTLTDGTTGGSWTSSTNTVATITTAGVLTGVALGVDTIGYSVTNTSGCSSSAVMLVNVDTLPTSIIVPAAGGSICHGNPVNLIVNSLGSGLSYQWYDGGTAIAGATTDLYVATTPGVYSVAISLGACNEILTGVTVYPQPNPIVSFVSPLMSTDTFTSYQWMFDGTIISGANGITYSESAAGNYQVIVTDRFGCIDTSAIVAVFPLGVAQINGMNVKLYPNPATSEIHIDCAEPVNVIVTTVDGKVMMDIKTTNDIDVSNLANGVYMFMVYDKNNQLLLTSKVVKMQ